MSKAEEKSQNRYPTLAEKYAFIDGYEQAEEDLELTWKDLEAIDDISIDVFKDGFDVLTKEYYQEVLKRFKDLKNERPV